MKNMTLWVLFLLLGSTGFAQKTLEFNRVLLVDATTDTVPVNAVWKVEKAIPSIGMAKSSSSGSSTPSAPGYWNIYVNGSSVGIEKVQETIVANHPSSTSNSTSAFFSVSQEMFPLWLPAGSTLAAGSNIQGISVIEFKVSP